MQDNYGRSINYLRLSITNQCNYRCIYCVDCDVIEKKEHGKILSIEEFINIGKTAVECGINKIRLTGGEPLIHDGVLKLCEGLKNIKGLDELAITTNGARLPEMAKDLKQAGVDRINISLDTLKEDKFRKITKTGSLSDVLNGVEAATKAGFKEIKINVVLMGGVNDDEINDFVNFTKDNEVSVRFNELMPIGPCKEWNDKFFIGTNEVIKIVPDLLPVRQDGVSSVYKIKDALGSVGLISPISNCFCENCNRIRITADGRIFPCLHSDLKYDVRNLSDKELKEIICLAIKNKPRRHHIAENHVSDNNDYMNRIGG